MTRRLLVCLLALVMPLAGAQGFTNITAEAGTAGPTARDETGGHGVMFADADGDGLPDFYVTMIFSRPMAELFYRNLGGGRFVEEGAARGVADFDGGSHGGCFADLDNDGDFDLVNGTTLREDGEPARNNLFRNDGRGNFEAVEGPFAPNPTRAVTCLDMDGDGDLDVFCVSGPWGSDDPPEERNEALRNEGDWHFTAVEAGDWNAAPCGQGITDTDFDGDGDVDLLAANRSGPLNVLANDGTGHFTRVDPASIGLDRPAKDGITAGDVDNDGRLDLVLASDDEGHLFRNLGAGRFERVQSFEGTDGYMAGLADLDSDGDLDLVFAGGRHAWMNDGTGAFSRGVEIPRGDTNDPRGIAFADIDGDGDLDFAVGCKRSGNQLIRNDLPQGNHVRVRLVSPGGQAGAFGAKVWATSGGTRVALREARGNNGYLGQNDPVLHVGMGGRETVDLAVAFNGGVVRVERPGVRAGETVVIDGRGEGAAQ